MSRDKLRSYSKEFKAQIIKECVETNNYAVVAKKHDVPATTVYTWFRRGKKSPFLEGGFAFYPLEGGVCLPS